MQLKTRPLGRVDQRFRWYSRLESSRKQVYRNRRSWLRTRRESRLSRDSVIRNTIPSDDPADDLIKPSSMRGESENEHTYCNKSVTLFLVLFWALTLTLVLNVWDCWALPRCWWLPNAGRSPASEGERAAQYEPNHASDVGSEENKQ